MHFSEIWAVTQKRLIVERNGRKVGPRGWGDAEGRRGEGVGGEGGICNMHAGIFDLEHVKVIRGHLVHFPKIGP